jgi:GNAT superfamily N-acetyltransferase
MSLIIPMQTYSKGNNSLSYGIVPWDSEIFGFSIVEAVDIDIRDKAHSNDFICNFEKQLISIDCKMLCVKVLFSDIETSWRLQGLGYMLVEQTIKPHITDIQINDIDYSRHVRYPLKKASSGDITNIQRIAFASFKYDRFHMDRRFDSSKASERYAYWVNNSFKSGEDVLYLDAGGTPAGFSIVDIVGNVGYIGLIGLDDNYKGKGLGMNLFGATCEYMKDKGVREVSTTMSLNNIMALNFYSRCGFRFKDPVYVLHKWL